MPNTKEHFEDIELDFLLLSLDEFSARINELRKYATDPATPHNIELNLGFISEAKRKFYNKEHDFSLNEMKVMYCAVNDRRDFINAALDDGFDNEDDHLDAMECLRIANSIIRKIKRAFISLGIDIDEFLSKGGAG